MRTVLKPWPVRILGTGAALPAQAVTAEELDGRLGLPPGTCLARNGVRTRYFAAESETASFLAAQAVERALAAAGLAATDLDAIVYSGVASEQPMPSTAVLVHRRLGGRAQGVSCFDVNASCIGFLVGCEIAAGGIVAGLWRQVAVVAAELASKGLNWSDPDTCTLFGDGAAAAVLGPASGDESAFLAVGNDTFSEGAELSVIRAGGSRHNWRTPPPSSDDYFFSMQGHRLLRLTQTHFPRFLAGLLAAAPVSVVVPHQASVAGLALLRRQLAARENEALAVVDVLAERGNQVSASLPTALDHAIREGALRRGDCALLVATGAGLTMNGIVLRY